MTAHAHDLNCDFKNLAERIVQICVRQIEIYLKFLVDLLNGRCQLESNAILADSLVEELNPVWRRKFVTVGFTLARGGQKAPLRDIELVKLGIKGHSDHIYATFVLCIVL